MKHASRRRSSPSPLAGLTRLVADGGLILWQMQTDGLALVLPEAGARVPAEAAWPGSAARRYCGSEHFSPSINPVIP